MAYSKTKFKSQFLQWGVFSSSPNPPSRRTTPCRLSATAFSIHSQLLSKLEAVLQPQHGDAPCRGVRGPLITEWWMIDLNCSIKLTCGVWTKCMAGSINSIRYRFVTPWMGLLIYTKSMSEDKISQLVSMGWLINDEVEITRKEVVMT